MALSTKSFLTAIKDNDELSDVEVNIEEEKINIKIGNAKNSVTWDNKILKKEYLIRLKESDNELHQKIFDIIVKTITFIKKKSKKTSIVKNKINKKVKNTNRKFNIPEIKPGKNDMVYSYSKRLKFLTSPRDYYFSYLFKLDGKTKGIQRKKKTSALFIGSIFHELLEVYYTAQQFGFKASEAYELAMLDFEITWTEDKKQELANQPTKEGTMLDNLMDSKAYFEHYYSYYKNNDFEEIIFSEISFLSELYKFDDEDLKDFRFLQHIKADLLVKDKGVYKLVEHKTHSQERTEEQRVSPQTLEYVEGIQKDLGIKIHSVIFNEIRKAKPKAFKFLKKGNISTAKKSLSNFSRVMLDQQYSNGLITEEQFRDGLECVNMDYYFHREERRVITQAQKNFSMEMKYSTKSLAKALVREHKNELAGKKSNPWEYPVNWTTNKKFASDFQSLYLAFFGGAEQTVIDEIIREDFEPKKSYGNNIETPLQRINRLSSLRKG